MCLICKRGVHLCASPEVMNPLMAYLQKSDYVHVNVALKCLPSNSSSPANFQRVGMSEPLLTHEEADEKYRCVHMQLMASGRG
jgi:hypothetical protein